MARTNATNFSGALQFPYATSSVDLFKKEDVQTLALAVDGHDHSAGKGLVLPAGAIPSGIITSAMIADGTIQTVDLAAGAVTQRTGVGGSTSNPQTTSSTYVDLPDMSVTITTTGGDLFAWLVCVVNSAIQATTVNIALRLDVGADVVGIGAAAPGVGYGFCLSTVTLWTGVSAGAHTIKGRWNTSGSTATAVSTQRVIEVLEVRR